MRQRFGIAQAPLGNPRLSIDDLFRGTLAQTSAYPREVVKKALERNAAVVIFSHNHLQRRLVALLAERGIMGQGGTMDRGALVVVRHRSARAWSAALESRGIVTDARGALLRLTPDVLTTDAELQAAVALAALANG